MRTRPVFAPFVAGLVGVLSAAVVCASCNQAPEMPPVTGGADGSGADAELEAEASVHYASCAHFGGTCTSGGSGSCPIQVTGIGLCSGNQICCAGYGD
jgi:hypothetical protein